MLLHYAELVSYGFDISYILITNYSQLQTYN